MKQIKTFLLSQAARLKARRIERHPLTRALVIIADLQISITDQWVRDLEFRGKTGANVDMIDIEHYNQLQALNDVINGLKRTNQQIVNASTTAPIDIKALQTQIHTKVGIVKQSARATAPKVQQMAAAAGGKP